MMIFISRHSQFYMSTCFCALDQEQLGNGERDWKQEIFRACCGGALFHSPRHKSRASIHQKSGFQGFTRFLHKPPFRSFQNIGPGLIKLEWIADEIPSDVPIDPHINDFLFHHMHHTMTGYGFESLLLRSKTSPNPISCVVYDSFLPWVPKFAAKLGIPHAFFWTQSATVFSLYYHLKTVGPSIPVSFLGGNPEDTRVATGADPWEGLDFINKWLDRKPLLSVIYVSFGSMTSISPNQIREIAEGLERSEQSFLWVIRPPKGHQDLNLLLPEGFVERVAERGLMAEWCVQLEVLSHPSVGVFMSHCGWNSTLEALNSGVPMLTMEIWADQPSNVHCGCMENRAENGKGENGVVAMEEIERCVRWAMEGGEGFAELRKRSIRWKEEARRAMIPGGSSDANLSCFTRELAAI